MGHLEHLVAKGKALPHRTEMPHYAGRHDPETVAETLQYLALSMAAERNLGEETSEKHLEQ